MSTTMFDAQADDWFLPTSETALPISGFASVPRYPEDILVDPLDTLNDLDLDLDLAFESDSECDPNLNPNLNQDAHNVPTHPPKPYFMWTESSKKRGAEPMSPKNSSVHTYGFLDPMTTAYHTPNTKKSWAGFAVRTSTDAKANRYSRSQAYLPQNYSAEPKFDARGLSMSSSISYSIPHQPKKPSNLRLSSELNHLVEKSVWSPDSDTSADTQYPEYPEYPEDHSYPPYDYSIPVTGKGPFWENRDQLEDFVSEDPVDPFFGTSIEDKLLQARSRIFELDLLRSRAAWKLSHQSSKENDLLDQVSENETFIDHLVARIRELEDQKWAAEREVMASAGYVRGVEALRANESIMLLRAQMRIEDLEEERRECVCLGKRKGSKGVGGRGKSFAKKRRG